MTNTTSYDSQGLTGGFDDQARLRIVLAVLIGLAIYNAVEIIIIVLNVFKNYKGLYFWSLLLSASLGVLPYSIGFMLKFFELASPWLCLAMLTVGWYCMVTGQAMVLYSRLHLVLRNQKWLRAIFIMICVNVVILHFPTTVFTFGANLNGHIFIIGYAIMERIQMTGFCIQEFIISGVYIYAIIKMLALFPDASKRKNLHQLLIINFLVILMDITLLGVEFANQYAFQITLKGVVYSIKLKVELAVLSNLVELVQPRRHHPFVGGEGELHPMTPRRTTSDQESNKDKDSASE